MSNCHGMVLFIKSDVGCVFQRTFNWHKINVYKTKDTLTVYKKKTFSFFEYLGHWKTATSQYF